MAFLSEELVNINLKALFGILGTGNRDAAPNNFRWFDEEYPLDQIIKPENAWVDFDLIPPAATPAIALANATTLPTVIGDYYDTGKAIHCTPTLNNRAFVFTSTYGDFSTWLRNWILPQAIPQPSGAASIGYSLRVFNGDPDSGGVEITTSEGSTSTKVGWIAHYASGALIVASDFIAITDPTDVWIRGFRYVGRSLSSLASGGGGGSESLFFRGRSIASGYFVPGVDGYAPPSRSQNLEGTGVLEEVRFTSVGGSKTATVLLNESPVGTFTLTGSGTQALGVPFSNGDQVALRLNGGSTLQEFSATLSILR